MKLYIIRHGETNWNLEGRLQGQTDIDLNENGIRLAKITAERMKDIPLDLGITSPLCRARKTAELLLEGRSVSLYEDCRLMELSFGIWEGLGCRPDNYEIPSEHFQDFYKQPFAFVPGEHGETIEELCRRTAEFYEELIHQETLQEKSILLATHGCASRALLYHIDQKHKEFWRGHVPVNCSVTIVEAAPGVSKILEEDKIFYNPEDVVDFYKN